MNRSERRRAQRPRRSLAAASPAPDNPVTFTLITELGTQHQHVFPTRAQWCDHLQDCEDRADWWRGMRPLPWTSPPWVMETPLSCGCDHVITGAPEVFEALAPSGQAR